MTMAAACMWAWRAARAAALRPAAVVRLKRVRTSHMRTQLWTTVALRLLQQHMRCHDQVLIDAPYDHMASQAIVYS